MNEIVNHLWQSTAFAVAIALATLALRRNSPRVRYWLWFAASMKFLIPFSWLVSTGSRIPIPRGVPALHAVTVQQMSIAFSPVVTPMRQPSPWIWVWAVGVLFFAARWFRNWRFVKTADAIEPGVHGLFRPVLRLPEGLTDEQLSAVIAHEERHIECFDNLTAALHMVVETLFWFHPLVWWIGARMMEERERDCDEAVLRRGSQPGAYARSIVQVCQTYIESPLACASGISGSDLKKRIREIMTWRGSLPVTRTRKAMLAVAAVAAVSLPFVLGVLRAQTLPPAPTLTYDAVSIHKSEPNNHNHVISPGPQGGVRVTNMSASGLIAWAYNVPDYQIVGAPGWTSAQTYDISFTPDRSEPTIDESSNLKQIEGWRARNMERMQAVLRDRFGLLLRAETRELPVFNLVQAKGGAKLTPHDPANPGHEMSSDGRRITGVDASMDMLTRMLASLLDRPVHDETHLNGEFEFKVTPDSDGPMSESLFTALPAQLGLKLESAKGPVQVYVIEKLEQPTEN